MVMENKEEQEEMNVIWKLPRVTYCPMIWLIYIVHWPWGLNPISHFVMRQKFTLSHGLVCPWGLGHRNKHTRCSIKSLEREWAVRLGEFSVISTVSIETLRVSGRNGSALRTIWPQGLQWTHILSKVWMPPAVVWILKVPWYTLHWDNRKAPLRISQELATPSIQLKCIKV